jgi:hypothetical protein
MSLAATTGRDDYTATGSVSEFTFTFAVYTKADLAVYANGVLQTLDTAYQVLEPGGLPFGSLAAASLPSTGKVRFIDGSGNPLPPANGTKILLLRAQPVSQLSEYVANEAFPSLRLEKDLDKLVAVAQQLREHLGRAITFATASLFKDKTLPEPTGTPKVIGFDGANNLVLFDLTTGAITGMVNPMSAEGDLIRGGAAGVAARLAKGADDTVLSVIAGALGYRLIPAVSLATDAVETAKVKDLNVTTAKLADGVLSADAAGRAKMADGYLTLAKLAAGVLTAPNLRRFEGSAQNAGSVTVTSGGTVVLTLDLGTVVSGDRILVTSRVVSDKGGTGGDTDYLINKESGTATIAFHHTFASLFTRLVNQAAASQGVVSLMGVAKVTGDGTLILAVRSASLGSNSTVGIGGCELYAWVIPGA